VKVLSLTFSSPAAEAPPVTGKLGGVGSQCQVFGPDRWKSCGMGPKDRQWLRNRLPWRNGKRDAAEMRC